MHQFSSGRRGRPRLGRREVAKGRDHCLYYNGHGDLAAEADGSGTRTALHTYDPFGAPLDAPPTNSTVHRYTGAWAKQYDTTSSLVLMGARPYDPNLGRFLAVDPIDGGSLNNYDYAFQDPVNDLDLSGLMAEEEEEATGIALVVEGDDSMVTNDPGAGSEGGEGAGKGFSNSTKDAARARAGNKCQYCGKPTTRERGPDQSQIDHNVPKSRNGNNSLENAVNSCRTCNLTKGAKTGREYTQNRMRAGRM
jgi:RHS repeat-associated protein